MNLIKIILVATLIAVITLIIVLSSPEATERIFITSTPLIVDPIVIPTISDIDYSVPKNFKGMVVVVPSLNIREKPSTAARKKDGLASGDVIELLPNVKQFQADGFMWVEHTLGWSARRSDSGHIYLEDFDWGTRFTRMPIKMAYVSWVQPFGDTIQARRYHQETYEYSDGKHGGIDFGVDIENVPVYASTYGAITKITSTGIRIAVPPYTVIYEHMAGIPNEFDVGYEVTPDTFIGVIDFSVPSNAHLHVEVRWKDKLIINPSQLLPPINWGNIVWREYPANATDRDPRYQRPISLGG